MFQTEILALQLEKICSRVIKVLQQKDEINLSKSCRLLRVNRQSIYQKEHRTISKEAILAKVKELVSAIRMKMPRLGTRKLYHLLKSKFSELNLKIGRDSLFSLLRSERMLIKRKKNYTKITDSKHWLKKHPNLYVIDD